MVFELDEYHRNVSAVELIADLKRVADLLGKDSLTHEEYKSKGKFGVNTFVRRLGSWNNSLKTAGLKLKNLQGITNEELFENLEEVWIKLGRQPKYREIEKPLSRYSQGTYEDRFGGWRKALEKFVAYINSEEGLSSEENDQSADIKPTKHKTNRSINLRLRFLTLKRDNFKCQKCGRTPASDPKIVLHVDHIKAWANGGETTIQNLETLCSKCNIGKSNLE